MFASIRRVGSFTLVFLTGLLLHTPGVHGQGSESTSFVLAGEMARTYVIPSDTELVHRRALGALGLIGERRQQHYDGTPVLGAQINVLRDGDGAIVRVIGRHFRNLTPVNEVTISRREATEVVARDLRLTAAGPSTAVLYVDPDTRRYFWRVTTPAASDGGPGVWEHWIDAENAEQIERFDAVPKQECIPATGRGRAYDRDGALYGDDVKDLGCLVTVSEVSSDDLWLATVDGRQFAADCEVDPHVPASHPDSTWDVPGRESPGTGALVDAHYYIALADSYFRTQYNYDFLPSIRVRAHAGGEGPYCGGDRANYMNAFWHPTSHFFGFGDGDGVTYDNFTSLDVAAHEFAHSITQFTSALVYKGESGALNESFSDIMAAVVERLVDTDLLPMNVSPRREPDSDLREPGSEWLIGEDFDLTGDGLRNMANLAADNQPMHYDDLYTGGWDNGGVHINSGIPKPRVLSLG